MKATHIPLMVVLATGMVMTTTPASAQAFPTRPLRLVVPFPPGGGTDNLARPVAQSVGDALGQPILVDNRAGGNTIIGAEFVARSAPDGYTLLLAGMTTLVLNAATYDKLPYDAIRDFAPIARLAANYQVVVTRAGFAPRNLAEMVALAKSKPGTITYASTGNGSPGHFGGVNLEAAAGIKLVHVPYKGNAPAISDMLAEQVDFALFGPSSVQALVKAGKLKVISAAAPARFAAFPDVPTATESGYAGYTSGTWYGVAARAGTPGAIIDRLNREINRALQLRAVKAALEKEGFEVDAGTSPQELARYIAEETRMWTKIARNAKIELD